MAAVIPIEFEQPNEAARRHLSGLFGEELGRLERVLRRRADASPMRPHGPARSAARVGENGPRLPL